MTHQKSCGIIPFIQEDNTIQYLLIKHNEGHWAFPKGHQEEGETDIETAVRELGEETGLTIQHMYTDQPLTENYTFTQNNQTISKTVVYFLAEVTDKSVILQDAEVEDHIWLPFEEARDRLTHTESKETLTKANDIINSTNGE